MSVDVERADEFTLLPRMRKFCNEDPPVKFYHTIIRWLWWRVWKCTLVYKDEE